MDIMKKVLRAKTIEDINILQEEFEKMCEARIEKLNFLNRISDISSFNEIKTIFESMAPHLISTNKGRRCVNGFIKGINENKSLQTAYLLNENITHCPANCDTKSFLTESLSLVENVSKRDFIKGVANLQKSLMEGVSFLSSDAIKAINKAINEININKEMGETLDSLTLNPKKMTNLLEFNASLEKMVPFMEEISKKNTDNENMVTESSEEILNRINEDETKENLELFKYLIEAEDKKGVFEDYKDNCKKAIKKAIKENKNDNEIVNKLSVILEKIEKKEYNISTYGADIASFMELENITE